MVYNSVRTPFGLCSGYLSKSVFCGTPDSCVLERIGNRQRPHASPKQAGEVALVDEAGLLLPIESSP